MRFVAVLASSAFGYTEEEVGLLQQRLTVGEGGKSEVDLDLDCKSGPKNCYKGVCKGFTCGAGQYLVDPSQKCKQKTCKPEECCEENPTCQDYDCKGWNPKDEATKCRGSECTFMECCEKKPTTTTTTKPLCSEFMGCKGPKFINKYTSDADKECKYKTCSTRECCGVAPTTTAMTTTTEMTTKMTTKPATAFEQCQIWGDPQVTSFDKLISARFRCNGKYYDETTVDSYKDGDYYLLRSAEIEVQGRFGSGMGTTRSMQREVAVKVGDEVLQVKPHSIYFQGEECGEGSNKGLNKGDTIGNFKVVPMGSGLVIIHRDVQSVKLWVQQVGASSPAVQAIIFKGVGALSGLAGLCGDADGDKANDCTEMIGDVNKVAKADSLFMAAPFEFAGCATASDVQWEWRTMGACSNADTCALKCKGFGQHVYYPEFYVKKSVQFAGQVDCFCANLEASQKTAWARFAMKPEKLKTLPQKSQTCAADACSSSKPMLGSSAICVFKEKEKLEPKVCSRADKSKFYKKCQADPRMNVGDRVHQCVADMCASDDPNGQEAMDGTFIEAAEQEAQEMSKMWTFSWTSFRR